METTLEHRIRERAYFLSQSGGGADDGTHFWLIAEREVLAEVAMESAATSQAMQLAETAKPTPVLRATKTAQQPAAEQPKEAALKPRAAAKGSAKTSTKASPPAAAAAVKSAVVTPIKSAIKTRGVQAI